MRRSAAQVRQQGPVGGLAQREVLRLTWCSDCGGERLFEVVPAEAHHLRAHDWACTACGAAYLDGIDLSLPQVSSWSGAAP
jgi:hypothetical protein